LVKLASSIQTVNYLLDIIDESLAVFSLSDQLLTNEFVARVTENLSNSHGTADVVQIG